MIVFLNGAFLPEEQAVVSVFDRSFLYGDGLFETLRVRNGKPFRWEQHFERLQRGAGFLGIRMPYASEELTATAARLVEKNGLEDAVMRLTLSRGVGRRGYSPKGADQPTLVMSLHASPELAAAEPPRWTLITASVRLPSGEALAQFKTCNKLVQVLARSEADAAGADEALLLNTDGFVAEASSSNLFWIEGSSVCTPPLACGGLAGVTRSVTLEICRAINITAQEVQPRTARLLEADGLFLSLSTLGIVGVRELDGLSLRRSSLVDRIRDNYERLLVEETA